MCSDQKIINRLQDMFNQLNYREYLHKCNRTILEFCFHIKPIITL